MMRRFQPGKLQSMWCLGMVAVSALALQGCTTNPVHSYYYGNSAGGMSRTDLIEVNERATDALLLSAPLDASQPVISPTLRQRGAFMPCRPGSRRPEPMRTA